jgi:hypothetical protein
MAKRVRLPKGEREAFWRRQIDDWAQSGKTISGFCRERGLTESAFHLWKRELSPKTSRRHTGRKKSQSSAPRLVPISVAVMPTSPVCRKIARRDSGFIVVTGEIPSRFTTTGRAESATDLWNS